MKQLTLLECSKRKLDATYLVVYAIKNELNLKKGDFIEKSVKIYILRFFRYIHNSKANIS